MGEPPTCFISYRADDAAGSGLMPRFWTDLQTELGKRGGTGVFQDRLSIDGGDGWEPKIVEALATARVFVALFTPGYFQRLDKPCYCGKEFQAFLQRSGDNRESANILPVLWTTPGPHSRKHFPPEVVAWVGRSLKGEATKAMREVYEAEGLEGLWNRKGSKPYKNILLDIVYRILAMADRPPPPSKVALGFDTIPCAFHSDAEEVGTFREASPTAITGNPGPSAVVLVYVLDGDKLDAEVADAALRSAVYASGFEPHALRWSVHLGFEQLHKTVVAATREAQIPVIAVSATRAAEPDVYATLKQLVAATDWIGGVAIVGTAVNDIAAADRVLVKALTGSQAAIGRDLMALLLEIRSRMNSHLTVATLPGGSGPDAVPTL